MPTNLAVFLQQFLGVANALSFLDHKQDRNHLSKKGGGGGGSRSKEMHRDLRTYTLVTLDSSQNRGCTGAR